MGLVEYALGIDIGTSFTAAAIWRSGDQQGQAEVVALGGRTPAVPAVLFLGADGSVLVGEAAERRALTDPDRVVRELTRRIGDETPVFVGGRPYPAHDLAAMMIRWVVDRVSEREGAAPERIAITHPAGWGPFKRELLSGALASAGLDGLSFLTEPEAAAISYAVQEHVDEGTAIAVYDLGGGTFDAAVVRKTGPARFAVVGSAGGLDQLGGADFDEAVFAHVRAVLGEDLDALGGALDRADTVVLDVLARLRRECRKAKEALSAETVVAIPVLLAGLSTDVRLVRGELEEMIRPALQDTVDSLCRAIRSAGVGTDELGAVLMVGGSSRIPLATQLVSARLGRSVVVDADPQATISLGAALSVALRISAEPGAAGSEPDRPAFIPTQRQPAENREPATRGVSRRRVRDLVVVGSLAGLLVVSVASAAPGGYFSAGPSASPSPSAQPPQNTEAPGGGGTADPPGPASPAPGHGKTPKITRDVPVKTAPTRTPVPSSPSPTTTASPSSSPSPRPSPSPPPTPSPSPTPTPTPTPILTPTPTPTAQPAPPPQAAPLGIIVRPVRDILHPPRTA